MDKKTIKKVAKEYALDVLGKKEFKKNPIAAKSVAYDFKAGVKWLLSIAEEKKRDIVAEIGVAYVEWADNYFINERLNIETNEKEAYEACRAYNLSLINISKASFRYKLTAYCEVKGYKLNPEAKTGVDGRIVKKVQGVLTEYIFLDTKNIETR